jgi:uncharacterized protein (DUF924 family)
MAEPSAGRPIATSTDVLAFWRQAGPDRWFIKDDAFDTEIRDKFLATYEAAATGKLRDWEATPEGTLALIIVLDQFPRNMFRDEARSFAADPIARTLANTALKRGCERDVAANERTFFFLPFMHSEDAMDQERCVELYRTAGEDYSLKYALEHAEIIRRFGRFPHRNSILGRATTPEEQAFLEGGGFKG